MENKEHQVIEECKTGAASAKEWIYKKYAPIMLGVCLRYVKDKMQAEDILHESFITVFDKIEQLKDNKAIQGWIKRIIINNSLNYLKKKKYLLNVEDINENTVTNTDENDAKDIKERILQIDVSQNDMLSIINNLPTGFRTVFNLFVFEKLKHSEISEKLGISSGTSKSQLLRARKQIQQKLYELVLEKEKNKHRKKVVLSSFIITMNDDLSYIDKIAHDKLYGFTSIPAKGIENIINAGANTAQSGFWGMHSKLLTILSKNIITISSIVIGTVGITFLVLSGNADKTTQTKTQSNIETPVINIIDTIINNDTIDNLRTEPITVQTKQKPVTKQPKKESATVQVEDKPVTVKIKKVITIKKKKIITDTIRKTDTLRL